jgi:hypothetical protein
MLHTQNWAGKVRRQLGQNLLQRLWPAGRSSDGDKRAVVSGGALFSVVGVLGLDGERLKTTTPASILILAMICWAASSPAPQPLEGLGNTSLRPR